MTKPYYIFYEPFGRQVIAIRRGNRFVPLEYCGKNHYAMMASAVVYLKSAFKSWPESVPDNGKQDAV